MVLNKLLSAYRTNRLRHYCYNNDANRLSNIDLPELSKAELHSVKEVWPCFTFNKKDLLWLRAYKKEHGFSPFFIGHYQGVLLRSVLNPKSELFALENKALVDLYFPEICFAKKYVRRIAGVYYDDKMNVMSLNAAVDLLMERGCYVIKPALGTEQGYGVEKVLLNGSKESDEKEVVASIDKQRGDFVAEEVLVQHPQIAEFNPSSVNSCRITSIYVNGLFDYSTILKIGKKSAFRDNWNSSYLVGVTKNGVTNNVGYDNKLNRYLCTDNGKTIGGVQLPLFEEMVSKVRYYHTHYFPNCGFIGWDIFVDSNNNVRIIEANLTDPGIVGEQLCSGTFFEPFHDDICRLMNYR